MGPPQALARLRIPTIDEPAGPELRAGNARDDNAVRDERRHGHRIAFLDVGRFLTPQLLAGLHVECNDVGVERGAEKLAVVNRTTAVDDAATHDARRLCRVLDLGLPDLFAGLCVNRHRGVVVGDVNDTLVYQRLRLRASIICEAVVPNRHQVLYVVLVDLRERTEPLQIIAHTVIENARCIGRSLDQLVGRLSACAERRKNDKAGGKRNALHAVPPNEFPARLFAGAVEQQSS